MKRLNISLSDADHEKLVLLREILEKANFDECISEIIRRQYKAEVEKHD